FTNGPLTPEYWPKGGQKLIRDDGHCAEVALRDGVETWFGYVCSFRSAADMLYGAAFAQGGMPGRKDEVFIPFAFLWRHYAELALKAAIINHSDYLGEHANVKELCDMHSLQALWDRFQVLDEKVFPEEPGKSRRCAGKTIGQLQKVDPGSVQFRY